MSCCRRRRTPLCYGEVAESYALEDVIGNGSTAIIRRGCNLRTDEAVAIKTIRLKDAQGKDIWSPRHLEQLMAEVDISFACRHPSLIKSYGAFFGASTLDIVMELALGGEVMVAFANETYHSEVRAQLILRQVCSALWYLHAKSIAHRDVKAENVMYACKTHCAVKLVDFGCARSGFSKDERYKVARRTLIGTVFYMAPEMFREADGSRLKMGDRCVIYGTEVDMWATGVFAFVVLFGLLPFALPRLLDDVQESSFQLLFPEEQRSDYSPLAEDFVTACLERDAGARLTAAAACAHPWMQESRAEERLERFSTWQQNVRSYVEATEDSQRVMPSEMAGEGAFGQTASQLIRQWESKVCSTEADPNESADEGAEEEQEALQAIKIVLTRRATQDAATDEALGAFSGEVILDPEVEMPEQGEDVELPSPEPPSNSEKKRRAGLPKKRSATAAGEAAAEPDAATPSDEHSKANKSKQRKSMKSKKTQDLDAEEENESSPSKAKKASKSNRKSAKAKATASSSSTKEMPESTEKAECTNEEEARSQVAETENADPEPPEPCPESSEQAGGTKEEVKLQVAEAEAAGPAAPQPSLDADEDPAKGNSSV